MMGYKGYDTINYHKSTNNTNPAIKNILQYPIGMSDDILRENCEIILKTTYYSLIHNVPNIQYHMTCMKDNVFNSGILIFEKPFETPFENPFESKNDKIDLNITNMLTKSRGTFIKLNAIKIEPTDRSMCGELNPEIRIIARTVTIYDKHVEWINTTRTNENNQIVPVLCHVTAANRWGVVFQSLAELYPMQFSQSFKEFLRQYPQTDIEIIGSNYFTHIVIGVFCMWIFYVIYRGYFV